jgi:integrase
MHRKKGFERHGLDLPSSKYDLTVIQYSRQWLDKREKEYPAATWTMDEQRLRDYVLPVIAEMKMSRVRPEHIRSLLEKISRTGFRKKDFQISESTRTRVKALLSALFGDAMNESPPLISSNPVLGVKVKGKRRGPKKPNPLPNAEACLAFLKAAKEISNRHFVAAATVLMSGIRKQELVALRWSCFDSKEGILMVREKFEQASNSILPGTKAGEQITRDIPIPAELVRILEEYRTPEDGPENFILRRPDGRWLHSRTVSAMIEKVREKAGLTVTTHGLRHTYGREFVLRTGNLKALQAILGHSSSATTDRYSDLAGERTRGFHESVSFDTRGVKKSGE